VMIMEGGSAIENPSARGNTATTTAPTRYSPHTKLQKQALRGTG
jgi:hypothetical protein